MVVKKREEIANIISCLAIDFNQDKPVEIPVLKFPEEKNCKDDIFDDLFSSKSKQATPKSKPLPLKPKSLPSILRKSAIAKNSNDSGGWIRKPKESSAPRRIMCISPVRECTRRKSNADSSFDTLTPPHVPLRKSARKIELSDKKESQGNEWKIRSSFSVGNKAQTRSQRMLGLANSQLEEIKFMSRDGRKCSEITKLPDKKRSYMSLSNKSENQNSNTFNSYQSTDPFYKNPITDPYAYNSEAVSNINLQ